LPPPPEGIARFEKIYRYRGKALPLFDGFDAALDDEGNPLWQIEDWSSPAQLTIQRAARGRALRAVFKGHPDAKNAKVAIARNVDIDLTEAKAIVLDVHSSLSHGFNVSLLLQTRPDWDGFESRPVFVRPGWNRNLRYPLNMDDFKSSKTEWKTHTTPFKPRNSVGRIVILLYNHDTPGRVLLDNMRIER
jgi:hypothetical protein